MLSYLTRHKTRHKPGTDPEQPGRKLSFLRLSAQRSHRKANARVFCSVVKFRTSAFSLQNSAFLGDWSGNLATPQQVLMVNDLTRNTNRNTPATCYAPHEFLTAKQ